MIAFLSVAWTWLTGPVGKYVMIGLAVFALIFGFAAWQRSAQAAKDAPWITDPVTHAKWKDEATQAQRDLGTCHGSLTTTLASLDAQNAAVDAAKADGDRRAKMLADGLADARKGRAGAEAAASRLLTHPPTGIDACARSEAAREAVLRALR